MNAHIRLVALLALCMDSALVFAAEVHAHGQATLSIAVDGGTLTLMLESPTDSLIGFEHAPRTAKERAAVEQMKQALNQPDKWFRPTAEAACKPARVKLESALFEAANKHAGHADLDGEFVFQCAQPEHLRDLEVRLFERFPDLKRLKVEVASPRGQKALQLNAKQNKVGW